MNMTPADGMILKTDVLGRVKIPAADGSGEPTAEKTDGSARLLRGRWLVHRKHAAAGKN
jgi:hypothetical protein